MALPVHAQPPQGEFNPLIVYLSASNDSDRAFIDAARAGIERAGRELDMDIPEQRIKESDDIATVLKQAADSGASPIIAVGYQHVMPVLNLAERYPNTQFTVIDGLVPPLFPNVQSILFKDHEGAFLVGIIAAKASRNGKVGFIGGMDIPLIRNFRHGFEQGVHHVDPTIELAVAMVGTGPEAWSNPKEAYQLAMRQYETGVDVIFAAAGGSGLGVLKAAHRAGTFAIGVDTNQNGLYPGHVLTSMVKRVDIAVYDTLKTSSEGKWNPGIKYLGIREGALDYAVDNNNRKLISEELIEAVAMAKERIINGILNVEMYSPK